MRLKHSNRAVAKQFQNLMPNIAIIIMLIDPNTQCPDTWYIIPYLCITHVLHWWSSKKVLLYKINCKLSRITVRPYICSKPEGSKYIVMTRLRLQADLSFRGLKYNTFHTLIYVIYRWYTLRLLQFTCKRQTYITHTHTHPYDADQPLSTLTLTVE